MGYSLDNLWEKGSVTHCKTGNILEKMEEENDGESMNTWNQIVRPGTSLETDEKTVGKTMSNVATTKKAHWEIMEFNSFCTILKHFNFFVRVAFFFRYQEGFNPPRNWV